MSVNRYTPIDVRTERFGRDPETYFGLFDLTKPLALWEIAVGRVSSHVGTPSGFGLSAWTYSLLAQIATNGVSQKYLDEIALELHRRTVAPDSVSRLDCVYLFPDLMTAQRAIARWDRTPVCQGEVRHLVLRFLTPPGRERITDPDDFDHCRSCWPRPHWRDG